MGSGELSCYRAPKGFSRVKNEFETAMRRQQKQRTNQRLVIPLVNASRSGPLPCAVYLCRQKLPVLRALNNTERCSRIIEQLEELAQGA